MASPPTTQDEDDEVEIIDLTDEPSTIITTTNKLNTTITLDDSYVVPIDNDESSDSSLSAPPSSSSSALSPAPSSPASLLAWSPPRRSITPSPRRVSSSQPLPKTPKMIKLTNKQAREEARKEKLRLKEEEKLQKEANRANAAGKALDNCTATVDKNILKLVNDQDESVFKTLFDESMAQYKLTDYPKVENCVTWTYKRMEIEDGNCIPKFNDSNWIIVIMQGSEYLTRLLAYKDDPDSSQSIKKYLTDIKCRTQSDVIMLVYNLSTYLKSERQKDAKNYRKTFKDRFEGVVTHDEAPSSSTAIGVSELQDLRLTLEMDFMHQHPGWKLHLEFYEKTNEIVQTLVRYTSSIAKLQVKQKHRQSTGLDWAINMDKEKSVDPTKSGDDLTKLWMTQLQQFSQVTLPIAKAIAAEYPSPYALLDQYRNLTTSEAENLLAELYVQRNLKRQIGPNISKRIHCFMTCEDPDVHIGLS